MIESIGAKQTFIGVDSGQKYRIDSSHILGMWMNFPAIIGNELFVIFVFNPTIWIPVAFVIWIHLLVESTECILCDGNKVSHNVCRQMNPTICMAKTPLRLCGLPTSRVETITHRTLRIQQMSMRPLVVAHSARSHANRRMHVGVCERDAAERSQFSTICLNCTLGSIRLYHSVVCSVWVLLLLLVVYK